MDYHLDDERFVEARLGLLVLLKGLLPDPVSGFLCDSTSFGPVLEATPVHSSIRQRLASLASSPASFHATQLTFAAWSLGRVRW